jgi:hypothetical protein
MEFRPMTMLSFVTLLLPLAVAGAGVMLQAVPAKPLAVAGGRS